MDEILIMNQKQMIISDLKKWLELKSIKNLIE